MPDRRQKTRKRWLGRIGGVLGGILAILLLQSAIALYDAARQPVDAVLVLGGSIKREMYAAQLAKQSPQTPILISSGSEDPCILLLFNRAKAPVDRVLLERCADSTFGNFYFALPILKQWHAHHVIAVTSASHLPRAKWLGQILLGAHGIWTQTELVTETGVPGNRESWIKTGLDVTRSLVWVPISWFYSPVCHQLSPLSAIELESGEPSDFKCEHQGGLGN